MLGTYAGFVDAGYLIAEGARSIGRKRPSVRPNALAVAQWFRGLNHRLLGDNFLRAYWYDGAFATSHREFARQRPYFDAIGYTPGIQLRLGHVAERRSRLEGPIRNALRNTAQGIGVSVEQLLAEFDRNWTFYPERQQKGVDTLITLDMVRLASRSAFENAIVISGDQDLAEVIRTVQDYGVGVLIATPNRESVASEVLQLADDVLDIGESEVLEMLTDRPTNKGNQA